MKVLLGQGENLSESCIKQGSFCFVLQNDKVVLLVVSG